VEVIIAFAVLHVIVPPSETVVEVMIALAVLDVIVAPSGTKVKQLDVAGAVNMTAVELMTDDTVPRSAVLALVPER